MATAVDAALANHIHQRPRASSFGRLNFGPRFNEGYVAVKRSDPSASDTAQEYSLYYRVYNPSSIHSTESPPLVVIHGGPYVDNTCCTTPLLLLMFQS